MWSPCRTSSSRSTPSPASFRLASSVRLPFAHDIILTSTQSSRATRRERSLLSQIFPYQASASSAATRSSSPMSPPNLPRYPRIALVVLALFMWTPTAVSLSIEYTPSSCLTSTYKIKVIPDDNSCLFSAVSLIFEQNMNPQKMRESWFAPPGRCSRLTTHCP